MRTRSGITSRIAAIRPAEPLLVAGDHEALSKWIIAFCSIIQNADQLPKRAELLARIPPNDRAKAEDQIVSCTAQNLLRYDGASSMAPMLILLGRLANPGDRNVMDHIRVVQRDIDDQSKNPHFATRISPDLPSRKERVLEAGQYALANLGDAEATASFLADISNGCAGRASTTDFHDTNVPRTIRRAASDLVAAP